MKSVQVVALIAVVCVLGVTADGEYRNEEEGEIFPQFPRIPGEVSDINFPTFRPSSGTDHDEANPSDVNWNETVDFLLSEANRKTLAKVGDEGPISDVNEKFSRKLGFITLKGEFNASGGRVKGISTLRRTGNITVVKHGTSFTITCPVGLGSVKVSYDHYRIKIARGPSMSGQIEGKIGSNSIQLKATIDITDEECSIRLDEVKILELSGLKVDLRGLGPPFDFLMSRISTWLTNVFKSDIIRNLERALTKELSEGLAKTQCEKYASYFIFVTPK